MTAATAAALLRGERPTDVEVAADYPTEFSLGVAAERGAANAIGPFVIRAEPGPLVVGEIGGAFTSEGVVEIGYAVVRSVEGRGVATAAVRALAQRLSARADVRRVVAHTPLDRPASGRVLEKAGFLLVGELDDTHEGAPVRVRAWALDVAPA
ncbi:MAG: GNAT family N-acetyltransferase [Polyangiaceae bacterium]|nr:GNAT family N-acetyltransferase [Polyangiaceae bacterium]